MEREVKNLKELIREIVEGILELRCSDEQMELLSYIHELVESENLKEISEIIEEYRYDQSRCPMCGAETEIEWINEDRGEYWGVPSTEPMSFHSCDYCGWEEEK